MNADEMNFGSLIGRTMIYCEEPAHIYKHAEIVYIDGITGAVVLSDGFKCNVSDLDI